MVVCHAFDMDRYILGGDFIKHSRARRILQQGRFDRHGLHPIHKIDPAIGTLPQTSCDIDVPALELIRGFAA